MLLELTVMLVVALIDAVVVSGAEEELQMRYGLQLFWSTEPRCEIFSRLPKYSRVSFSKIMMLKQ